METEKSSLHRIIKKLKGQVEELKERLEKVSNHNTMQTSTEMAKLHNDLDKQKIEIADLKHANTKLKKNIHDKSEELTHWQRKCDNNDKEVRALRNRIGKRYMPLKNRIGPYWLFFSKNNSITGLSIRVFFAFFQEL